MDEDILKAIQLEYLILPAVGAAIAMLCLSFALRAGRRRRLVQNLPTSKTTGVFIGLVEVKGSAESEKPLISYLSATVCVYYNWTVTEHWSKTVTESYTDSKGHRRTRTRRKSGWTTVAEGGDMKPFYIKDDYGDLLVRPQDAQIEPLEVMDETCTPDDPLYYSKGPESEIPHSDHRRCFHEEAIPLHVPLYVIGQARERHDIVAAEIASDPSAPMFIISTRTEKQIGSGMFWNYWGLGSLGLAIAIATSFLDRSLMRVSNPSLDIFMPIGFVAGYLLFWFLGWIWMVYNSMVELRQRVRQGWANVDVQLKRRHDLIPRLVDVVKGMRGYEEKLQSELVQLRTQLTATAPGEPGPDPQGCGRTLIAIAESYPELKANSSFMNLQANLADTENRIGLARSYFNDIATFYNTRLEVIPDRFISSLAGLRSQPLMADDGFSVKSCSE